VILAITAGVTQPSSSRLLADRIAEAVGRRAGVEVDVLELRDLAHDITNTTLTGFPSPALAEAVERVRAAEALVVVSPTYSGSFSGLFKSFFDVIDRYCLTGMPVLVGATGGSTRHALALDHAVRPLFAYLHAAVVPTAVYAASEDWGAEGADALPGRIDRAAGELAELMLLRLRPGRSAGNAAEPEVVPFAQQLAALRVE
jgi:FMN reductase